MVDQVDDDIKERLAEIWQRMPPSGSDLAEVTEEERKAVADFMRLIARGGNG